MKYVLSPELNALANCLVGRVVGDLVYDARVEMYTCKATEADRKFERALGSQYREDTGGAAEKEVAVAGVAPPPVGGKRSRAASEASISIDNPMPTSGASPFGDLADSSNRRVFAYCIETLNCAFPDYDFSTLKPDDFERKAAAVAVPQPTSSSAAASAPNHRGKQQLQHGGGAHPLSVSLAKLSPQLAAVCQEVNTQLADVCTEEVRQPMLQHELEALAAQAATDAADEEVEFVTEAGTVRQTSALSLHSVSSSAAPAAAAQPSQRGKPGRGGAAGSSVSFHPSLSSHGPVEESPAAGAHSSAAAVGGGGAAATTSRFQADALLGDAVPTEAGVAPPSSAPTAPAAAAQGGAKRRGRPSSKLKLAQAGGTPASADSSGGRVAVGEAGASGSGGAAGVGGARKRKGSVSNAEDAAAHPPAQTSAGASGAAQAPKPPRAGRARHGSRDEATPPVDGGKQRLQTLLGRVYARPFSDALWAILDDCINLAGCDLYSYVPKWDTDPLTAGALWSFNYFFHNRSQKKVLLFAVVARSSLSSFSAAAEAAGAGARFLRAASASPEADAYQSPSPAGYAAATDGVVAASGPSIHWRRGAAAAGAAASSSSASSKADAAPPCSPSQQAGFSPLSTQARAEEAATQRAQLLQPSPQPGDAGDAPAPSPSSSGGGEEDSSGRARRGRHAGGKKKPSRRQRSEAETVGGGGEEGDDADEDGRSDFSYEEDDSSSGDGDGSEGGGEEDEDEEGDGEDRSSPSPGARFQKRGNSAGAASSSLPPVAASRLAL